jgi:CRISPR/Cas system-associated protein Cas10 (large subunit of type III CRISPR-Cas system)
MNRVLLNVAKALDAGTIDPAMAHDILSFVVETKSREESAADESVALAEFIRRGLVNATTTQDEIDCYTILDDLRNHRSRSETP